MKYDLFISYSRLDDQNSRVTEFKTLIEREYYEFTNESLVCFFDKSEIKVMDDWKHKILHGLMNSQLLLIVLSPNYLKSDYCEWEVVEYLKYEFSRATQGEGVAQVYFVEIPGIDDPEFQARANSWLNRISRRHRFDFRPWYSSGLDALKQEDVSKRLNELKTALNNRIVAMRNCQKAIGNLSIPCTRFMGRHKEMKALHQMVALGRLGSITVIHGMGGLGKSSIATQYAYAYADYFSGGRWIIPCSNETNLYSAIKSLDIDLKITLTDQEVDDDLRGVKRVLNELERLAQQNFSADDITGHQSQPLVLLILDNVDHKEMLEISKISFLAANQWLKIIVSSRLGEHQFGISQSICNYLRIDALLTEDAVSLIESYQEQGAFTDAKEKESAKQVVELLGNYTLAIEMTAIYLSFNSKRITVSKFLEILRRDGLRDVLGKVGDITQQSINYKEALSSIMRSSIELLDDKQQMVLKYASMIPADLIPVPWLRELVASDFRDLSESVEVGLVDPWLDLMNRLLSLGYFQVVDLDPDLRVPRLVKMHRLLQEQFTDIDFRYFGALVIHVWGRARILSDNWHENKNKWEIAPLSSFVEKLLDDKIQGAHRMVYSLCTWLPEISNATSLRLMQKQLESLDIHADVADLDRINYTNLLGMILSQRGDTSTAINIFKRAHNLYESSDINDNCLLSQIKNNLARALHKQNEHEQAIEIMETVIRLAENDGSADKSLYATYLNNLAEMLICLKDFSRAESLMKRSLNIRCESLEDNHPMIALSYKSLGKLYMSKGEMDLAEEYINKALPLIRNHNGEMHFRTAEAMELLADVHLNKKNAVRARALYSEVFAIRSKVLSENHPDTLRCINQINRLDDINSEGELYE